MTARPTTGRSTAPPRSASGHPTTPVASAVGHRGRDLPVARRLRRRPSPGSRSWRRSSLTGRLPQRLRVFSRPASACRRAATDAAGHDQQSDATRAGVFETTASAGRSVPSRRASNRPPGDRRGSDHVRSLGHAYRANASMTAGNSRPPEGSESFCLATCSAMADRSRIERSGQRRSPNRPRALAHHRVGGARRTASAHPSRRAGGRRRRSKRCARLAPSSPKRSFRLSPR
jgi:hypothetical protein